MRIIPSKVFLTKGVGVHKEKLSSFEMALRNAGISQLNIVRVSSIFPPRCQLISVKEGLKLVSPGEISHVVISENSSNEPHRLMAASIGVAIPRDPSMHGYLSEHHSFGQKEKAAADYAEDLAATMLATILGVDFDPDSDYDTRRALWKISGAFVKTKGITQTAIGNKLGYWTSVLTAAVLIP